MFSHQVPFFVNATSGSTVLGAYDDLEALAEVCAKHKVISHLYCQKILIQQGLASCGRLLGGLGNSFKVGVFHTIFIVRQVLNYELFTRKYKHLMKGSDKVGLHRKHIKDLQSFNNNCKVDSIAWNPHKMVGAPLQTSPFIVRHKVKKIIIRYDPLMVEIIFNEECCRVFCISAILQVPPIFSSK